MTPTEQEIERAAFEAWLTEEEKANGGMGLSQLERDQMLTAWQARAALQPTGWLPIESAPKDGSKFLVGRFVEECKHGKNNTVAVDRWHSTGNGDEYTGYGKFNASYYPATHWMPLPPAPTLETK